jgi:hypothetical protein
MEGKLDEMGFLNPCNTHENIDWHVRDVYLLYIFLGIIFIIDRKCSHRLGFFSFTQLLIILV